MLNVVFIDSSNTKKVVKKLTSLTNMYSNVCMVKKSQNFSKHFFSMAYIWLDRAQKTV